MAQMTHIELLRQFLQEDLQEGNAGNGHVRNNQYIHYQTPILERYGEKYILNNSRYSLAFRRLQKRIKAAIPEDKLIIVNDVFKYYDGSLWDFLEDEDRIPILNYGGWVFYLSGKEDQLDQNKCGKWMYFFRDREFVEDICEKAVVNGVVYKCMHSDYDEGIACFYLSGDDTANHKRVIRFFLDNDLIRKTKNGKLYNISFKYDYQSRAGEFGPMFKAAIKLDQFIDLKTGKWKI
ncbi:MAG: hypothetical protein IJJ29_07345 [Solobacterium sp.]|nr:hypothetical protein [Solobacterium sp.]